MICDKCVLYFTLINQILIEIFVKQLTPQFKSRHFLQSQKQSLIMLLIFFLKNKSDVVLGRYRKEYKII